MSSNASSSSTADDGSFVKIDSKDVKLRQRKTSITGRKKSQSQLNTEAILSGAKSEDFFQDEESDSSSVLLGQRSEA